MDACNRCRKMTDNSGLWVKTMVPTGSTVKQAIQVLNETSLKIVLVVDPDGVLVGTISDGDIRRGLLKGLELNSSIDSIVHTDALVVPPELSREVVVQLMTANKIQQIPIVDESMQVIGMHLWDAINEQQMRTNFMVIMAGGKGTRLHPQTENCPKPMLPVAGKPILEHIIDRAKIEGFSNFIIATHHLGHIIEKYFGTGETFGVKIDYLREDSPLGTAGALSLLDPLPDEALVITNGDVLTDIHYGELLDFHTQHNAIATMAVRVHEWQNPFGVVRTRGIEIIGYEEKPLTRAHINAGVYVLEPSAITMLVKSEPCDMPSLFSAIQEGEQKVIAYPIHERWLDVGRPGDLNTANTENLHGDGKK
jgi:dTDP-glucose pyrophosphorylase